MIFDPKSFNPIGVSFEKTQKKKHATQNPMGYRINLMR